MFFDSVYGKCKRIRFNVKDYGYVLWNHFNSKF
jgi:hypothetical protein